MKKFLLTSILSLCIVCSKAQSIIDTTTCFSAVHVYLDSIYTLCDTLPQGSFNIAIENTNNNIWQIGKTTKFGTSDSRDTSCAIMTDSVNAYPINNFSAFKVNVFGAVTSNPWDNYNINFKFWHKFDTDSLMDGCWLEFSEDSGITWKKLDSLSGGFPLNQFQNQWSACNLYNNNLTNVDFDTIQGGTKAWSGNSNGWRYTALWVNMTIPIKPSRSGPINAIRFVFQSDSINNNKAGWIIDDFGFGWIEQAGAVQDYSLYNQLPVYPNPSTGIFTISYPSHYVKGNIKVYDIHGRKLIDQALSPQLDLSKYANGLYYYKANFDGKEYAGVLHKN